MGYSNNTKYVIILDFKTTDKIDSLHDPHIYLLSIRKLIVTCNILASNILAGKHVKILKPMTINFHTDSNILSFKLFHNVFIELGVRNCESRLKYTNQIIIDF